MKIYNKQNPDAFREIDIKGPCPSGWTRMPPPSPLPGKTVTFALRSWRQEDTGLRDLLNLERIRSMAQKANKERCRLHILTNYPIETQLSATANIYGAEFKATMIDFIAACIHAENTAFDAISTATTIDDIYVAAAEMILPEGGDQ